MHKIGSGLFEIITNPSTGEQYIHQTPMHFLAVKKSGGQSGIGVVQRVVMAQPTHIEQIVFGEDSGAPLKRIQTRGISVDRILKREPEFRTTQARIRGTAIQSNDRREQELRDGKSHT